MLACPPAVPSLRITPTCRNSPARSPVCIPVPAERAGHPGLGGGGFRGVGAVPKGRSVCGCSRRALSRKFANRTRASSGVCLLIGWAGEAGYWWWRHSVVVVAAGRGAAFGRLVARVEGLGVGTGCAGWAPHKETGLCEESTWTRHSRDVQRSGENASLVPTEAGSTRMLCLPGWARGAGGTSFPVRPPGRCGTGQPGSEPSQHSSVQSVGPDGAERRGAGILLVALGHPSSPVLGHRASWCSAFGLRLILATGSGPQLADGRSSDLSASRPT